MKLFIDEDLGFDIDKVSLIGEFCLYCADMLPIQNGFNVHVVSDRDSNNIATTAVYEVGNNTCKIYAKNRALVDICRSIAHEMTHMMQDETGLLVGHIQDAGGFHEDQANARAGELLKLYAKSSPDRKRIYEGYKKSLPFVYNRLTAKGYMYLDEYYSLKFPGAKIATDEFFAKKKEKPFKHFTYSEDFQRWAVIKDE